VLDEGFYKFEFSSLEYMRRILVVGSWSLSPGLYRTCSCTKDFIRALMKLIEPQCWVCVHGLPMKYWQLKAIFLIARGIGTPLALHDFIMQKSKRFLCPGHSGC